MQKIKNKNGQGYLLGAIILSAGSFISKLLGAVYRIPLLRFLGSEGMGIYQLVYPLYCILLTVSASGIPTGVARIVASGKEGAVEQKAMLLYAAVGAIGSCLMAAGADLLAYFVGEPTVTLCCRALSPAVFFVSVISVIRGYFQGKSNMFPTAISEICEQLIKVALGSAFAWYYRSSLQMAVAGAVFAVTLSEAATAIILALYYAKNRGIQPLYLPRGTDGKGILRYTLPLTLMALALPLSQFLESVWAVRLLGKLNANPVALYGIYSGCAVTLVNLPVSLTYGFAAAGVPKITPLVTKGDYRAAFAVCKKCLLITFAVSLPCAVAVYFGAPLATSVIFRSLSTQNKALCVRLVRMLAPTAVTLSLVQTSSACLTALGKPKFNVLTQWVLSGLRVILTVALIPIGNLSVAGAAISANCCYLLAVLLNFCYIISMEVRHASYHVNRFRNGNKRYFVIGKKSAG